jgi:hypothetical protein
MVAGLDRVRHHRKAVDDAYNFNWTIDIPPEFQAPFEVTHDSVAALDLHLDRPVHVRAANLRRMFSALVAGNIKEPGIRQIEAKGPFVIKGDRRLMQALDSLLAQFVAQNRMKIAGDYKPVYRIAS